jgi:uncharacterized membrane-anchored protein YhcB (DUF1043 family)
MHITAPQWEWKWNVNTIAVLVGFAAGFVAWGYTLSELRTGRTTNAENIARLDVRMTNIEATSRVLENHEQRLTVVEREARDAATNSRSMQETMGKLATDMAVVREILQRLEQGQNGSR